MAVNVLNLAEIEEDSPLPSVQKAADILNQLRACSPSHLRRQSKSGACGGGFGLQVFLCPKEAIRSHRPPADTLWDPIGIPVPSQYSLVHSEFAHLG